MTRYQLKKGFQAAAWLRQRLCTRRSPYIAGLSEENVAKRILYTSKNPNTSSRSTQPPYIASNLHGEESIEKRNSHITEDSISSKFHLISNESPRVTISHFICNENPRGTAHRKSSALLSTLLEGAHPSAKSFRGFRSYSADSHGKLQRFQRSFRGRRWGIRQYVLVGVSATGLCLAVYYSHIEAVPYTCRKHFVLIPPDLEIQIVENQFIALKEEWKQYIVPRYHPDSIRVHRIARDIIKAVLEGIQQDSQAAQLDHRGKVRTLRGDTNLPVFAQRARKEEVLDHQWMDESRWKGMRQGVKPFVEHLKKTKWEVLIVDKDIVNAFCLPGGKIVVFTGLLRHFPSDEEIATVLGHEVAHVVARHSAERMTRHLYLTLIQLLLLAFFYAPPDLVQSLSILFLELPFSRKQELEADHIGLLLMAAAGYDPRVAPLVYEKLGELGGKTVELLQYVTTHPSGKKRGQRLRSTGTMEQALKIYEEKVQGRITEGFLQFL